MNNPVGDRRKRMMKLLRPAGLAVSALAVLGAASCTAASAQPTASSQTTARARPAATAPPRLAVPPPTGPDHVGTIASRCSTPPATAS